MTMRDVVRTMTRGRMLAPGTTAFVRCACDPPASDWTSHTLSSGLALPTHANVTALPDVRTKVPGCEEHPDAVWTRSLYHVWGLGTLILTGTVSPDGRRTGDGCAWAHPEYGVISDVAGFRLTVPGSLAALDPGFAQAWLVRRAVWLIEALAVYWFREKADNDTKRDPLMIENVKRWAFRGDVPTGVPGAGFVLTDPATY